MLKLVISIRNKDFPIFSTFRQERQNIMPEYFSVLSSGQLSQELA